MYHRYVSGKRSAEATLTASIAGRELMSNGQVREMLDAAEPSGLRSRLLRGRHRVLELADRLTRRLLGVIERISGTTRVECPICGWSGAAFRPFVGPGYFTPNEVCPSCLAASRHRLFAVAWRSWSRLPQGGRCLYVAPEPCLREVISQDRSIITTDISRTDVDLIADLEHLPIESRSIQMVVCSDVLEHVFDDHAALREIRRILSTDGVALVHVPIMVDITVDYGRAINVDYGHVRAYGPDLLDRFHAAGFDVDVFGTSVLDAATSARAGLTRDAVFALAPA